ERAAVFVPSISLDYRSYRFFAGAELGVRIRPTEDFAGARIGTEGVIAAGIGLDVLKQHDLLAVTAEARLHPVFTEQATVAQSPYGLQSSANGTFITPAEWMITARTAPLDRKSTRLNSSHLVISYAVFCLKKKKKSKLYTSQ